VNIFQKGTLLLEEADIVHLIKDRIGLQNFLYQVLETLEKGFRQYATKQITVPSRQEFYFNRGTVESMPASDRDYFSCKIVNTHLENPCKFGISTIIASGLLVDGETGYPIMITESTILTALRTGIASALATKYLANKTSNSIGIIGNGAQALPQLHSISLIRDIKRVYAYDIDFDASKSFKRTAERIFKDLDIRIAPNSKSTCSVSDILVTATCKEKNTSPIVCNRWIQDGTHINAVGGDSPNKVELEKSLLERAKVVVDFIDQAVYEGESQQIPSNKIYGDLSEIVTHRKNGRMKEDEVTVFDSVGFAMEDLQVYKLVYELATREGIGKRVNIASRPKYSKNIYESYFYDL
jgi:ornithine cyclodeaminase/alanine dehydrogenase-like protein (mu-crystallin family)